MNQFIINMRLLPNDVQKCTGETANGFKCVMRQNCKRYLDFFLNKDIDEFDIFPMSAAPSSIEQNTLDCPLKIQAHDDR
jgi:hypothetical protein